MNKKEYLLMCLAEECSEVAQAVSKALRFGLDENKAGQEVNNQFRIEEELNDLFAIIETLNEEGILFSLHRTLIEAKKIKVQKYLDYSKSLGIVND